MNHSSILKVSNENLTWICPACKSIVTTWSAPAADSKSATSLTVSMVVKVVVKVVVVMEMMMTQKSIILGHDWSPRLVNLVCTSKGIVGDDHCDRG